MTQWDKGKGKRSTKAPSSCRVTEGTQCHPPSGETPGERTGMWRGVLFLGHKIKEQVESWSSCFSSVKWPLLFLEWAILFLLMKVKLEILYNITNSADFHHQNHIKIPSSSL